MASTIRDMDLLMRRGRREPAYVGYGLDMFGGARLQIPLQLSGHSSHGEGNDTEWSRGQPDIAYLIPRTGQVRNTAGGPHGHPGEKDSVPQDTTGSKNGSQVQHLAPHGGEGAASHVGGGEAGPKKEKVGSHSRQGTFDEDGGVTKQCGCRGTSGYLQLGSGLGSRRARASTVGPSESCPAPSVSKAIEIIA